MDKATREIVLSKQLNSQLSSDINIEHTESFSATSSNSDVQERNLRAQVGKFSHRHEARASNLLRIEFIPFLLRRALDISRTMIDTTLTDNSSRSPNTIGPLPNPASPSFPISGVASIYEVKTPRLAASRPTKNNTMSSSGNKSSESVGDTVLFKTPKLCAEKPPSNNEKVDTSTDFIPSQFLVSPLTKLGQAGSPIGSADFSLPPVGSTAMGIYKRYEFMQEQRSLSDETRSGDKRKRGSFHSADLNAPPPVPADVESQFTSNKTQRTSISQSYGSASDYTSADVYGSRQAGSSCHQCKNRREIDTLSMCSNKHAKERGGIRRTCRKKFCDHCLDRFYGELPPTIRHDAASDWECPACRGFCTCAACKKRRN